MSNHAPLAIRPLRRPLLFSAGRTFRIPAVPPPYWPGGLDHRQEHGQHPDAGQPRNQRREQQRQRRPLRRQKLNLQAGPRQAGPPPTPPPDLCTQTDPEIKVHRREPGHQQQIRQRHKIPPVRYHRRPPGSSSERASAGSIENRTPSWRVTSSANTRVYHSVDFASLCPISVWMTFCGTWCCTRCIANESRNVLGVTGRMEKVTPSRSAAATACEIQLRAVSSLLISHSRAPAGGFTVANHSLNRCTNPGSVSGTARGGLSLISASASRSACCSSFVGRPRRRLRFLAASSSPRCLRVRSTTNGDDSGAPVSGSSSTKSSRVSGSISFSRPPVFHRASMNSRLRRSVTLASSTATSGASR